MASTTRKIPSGSYAKNVKRIRPGVVSVSVTQPVKYAGIEASHALNPFGTMKKSVPPRRRVMMRDRKSGRRLASDNWLMIVEDGGSVAGNCGFTNSDF